MNDALGVGGGEGGADLGEDEDGADLLHRPLLGERLQEVRPLRELHRDEGLVALDSPIEHLDHVRVLEVGGGLGLSLEAAKDHRVPRQLALEDLERDRDPALLIERSVDGRHPATPEDAFDAEAPDKRAPDQALGVHPTEQGISVYCACADCRAPGDTSLDIFAVAKIPGSFVA